MNGFEVSTAAKRAAERQMLRLHAALILAAGAALTGLLVAPLFLGGR